MQRTFGQTRTLRSSELGCKGLLLPGIRGTFRGRTMFLWVGNVSGTSLINAVRGIYFFCDGGSCVDLLSRCYVFYLAEGTITTIVYLLAPVCRRGVYPFKEGGGPLPGNGNFLGFFQVGCSTIFTTLTTFLSSVSFACSLYLLSMAL